MKKLNYIFHKDLQKKLRKNQKLNIGKIKKFLNSKYAISCSSGTSALHLSMLAIGLKKDDVVIMPAINFIASYVIENFSLIEILFQSLNSSSTINILR